MNQFYTPTERLVNGIDGSLNNIRRLTRDLRQQCDQLNIRHNTLQQNFDNTRNERNALRTQTNLDQQNINILGQQNIDFQRHLYHRNLSLQILEKKRARDVCEKIASHTLNRYLTTALIELQQKYNRRGDTWRNASLA